jgi:hypothetical protein
VATVVLDAARIADWDSFHAVSAASFGFPAFYGRSMNAWIDCLTDLDGGMSRVALKSHETLTIELRGAGDFAERCPEIALALMSATAAINARSLEDGARPRLALLLA